MEVDDKSEKSETCERLKVEIPQNYKNTIKTDEMNPALEKALHKIAQKEGFTDYKIQSRNLASDGSNYLGVLTEVTIKGTTNYGAREKNIFTKSIIPGHENFKLVDVSELYGVEVFVYTELSGIFTELQNEAKIPSEDRFNFVKCYKESNTEFIIMDNMAKNGYGTYNKFDIVSLEFAKTCIGQLAKFHGLSMVLERKQPEYFNKKMKSFKHRSLLGEEWEMFMSNMYNVCFEDLDSSAQKKLKKHFPGASSMIEKFKEYYLESDLMQCLCHGDYRANNILKKEKNSEVSIIPVDYQLINYGPPIFDLMYFVLTVTDREFRRKHLKYLKNHYYDSLEKFMQYFGINVDKIYPKKRFETDYKEKLDYTVIMSVWLLPMLLVDDDNEIDLGNTHVSELSFGKNDRVKVRFQEVVEDVLQ